MGKPKPGGQKLLRHAKRGTTHRRECRNPQAFPGTIAAGGFPFPTELRPSVMAGMPAVVRTGPDLTRSKLVSGGCGGDKIGDVVLHGRTKRACRRSVIFRLNRSPIWLPLFIPSRPRLMAQSGKRKGVDVSIFRLETSRQAKPTSMAPAACASCHSPTGDLAGYRHTL